MRQKRQPFFLRAFIFLLATICGFVTIIHLSLRPTLFNERHLEIEEKRKEPSYIQMCRSIVKPISDIRTLVEESPEICHNLDRPHSSLLQIFASEMISEVARLNHVKVWYRHHCFPPPLPNIEEWLKHVFPIQEFLPSPLLTMDHAEAISLESMINICHQCIHRFENEGKSSPDCILFSKANNNKEEPIGIEMMIPSIQKNMMYASNLWAVQKNYPLIEELRNKAIVYINCKNDVCTVDDTMDSIAIDNLAYFLEMPKHLHEINIIAPKSCGSICEEKGKQILHLMTVLFPTTLVLFSFEESSAALFSKMMTTGHLICTHTEACLIPAIAQGEDKYTSFTIDPNRKTLLASLQNTPTEKILPKNIDFIDEQETLMIGRNGNCRHVRGRFGQWTYDTSFAPHLQYKGRPLDHQFGRANIEFTPTEEHPFRAPTTFKWETSFFPGCHVNDLVIRASFCHVLKKMEIERVFMIGDSSVQSQAISLWKVLGNGDNPYNQNDPNLYPNFRREMECSGGNIEISYTRNDHLLENELPVSYNDGVRNCGTIGFCYPWIERYLSFSGKTLLIAGAGSNIPNYEEFQNVIDRFIRTINSFHRSHDFIFFRTNHPAHENCQVPTGPSNQKPLENYEQILELGSDNLELSKVEKYNEYLHHVAFNRNVERLKGTPRHKMRIEILDIYPMTALRNDGHLGGEECVEETCSDNPATRDCFHYFLPGPVDWWNHLLYNNLMDLGLEVNAFSSYVVQALKNPP